uniref:Uncharacterized protein n=1 Tax=Panagrolaimus sp. ES5 TaxID=591445 RepID=A0AC34GL50_9BILA
MCTTANECYAGIVILCFDSDVPNYSEGSKQCRSNQCEFQAGFSRDSGTLLAKFFKASSLVEINEGCGIVTMKSPTTTFFNVKDSSCFPKIYEGNVVKMDVKQASPQCKAKIIGAREWTPPTSTAASISSTNPTSNAKESSITKEAMWIIIAVVVV